MPKATGPARVSYRGYSLRENAEFSLIFSVKDGEKAGSAEELHPAISGLASRLSKLDAPDVEKGTRKMSGCMLGRPVGNGRANMAVPRLGYRTRVKASSSTCANSFERLIRRFLARAVTRLSNPCSILTETRLNPWP